MTEDRKEWLRLSIGGLSMFLVIMFSLIRMQLSASEEKTIWYECEAEIIAMEMTKKAFSDYVKVTYLDEKGFTNYYYLPYKEINFNVNDLPLILSVTQYRHEKGLKNHFTWDVQVIDN